MMAKHFTTSQPFVTNFNWPAVLDTRECLWHSGNATRPDTEKKTINRSDFRTWNFVTQTKRSKAQHPPFANALRFWFHLCNTICLFFFSLVCFSSFLCALRSSGGQCGRIARHRKHEIWYSRMPQVLCAYARGLDREISSSRAHTHCSPYNFNNHRANYLLNELIVW